MPRSSARCWSCSRTRRRSICKRLREAGCIKAWREATHTIKGSASAIGAWRLARFAEMAEKVDVEADIALREGHRDEAVAAVATAAEEACRFIARLLPGRLKLGIAGRA